MASTAISYFYYVLNYRPITLVILTNTVAYAPGLRGCVQHPQAATDGSFLVFFMKRYSKAWANI